MLAGIERRPLLTEALESGYREGLRHKICRNSSIFELHLLCNEEIDFKAMAIGLVGTEYFGHLV